MVQRLLNQNEKTKTKLLTLLNITNMNKKDNYDLENIKAKILELYKQYSNE